jgi:mono/diheme cytochrome c family protein
MMFKTRQFKPNTKMQRNTLILLAAAIILPPAVSLEAQSVAQLWSKNCASCHGEDGKANTRAGRRAGAADLTKPENQTRSSDEEMFRSVVDGVFDERGRARMKPAEGLSDAEIRMLIAYVRRFVGPLGE